MDRMSLTAAGVRNDTAFVSKRRSKLGRPREFDEELLRDAIMRLFWRYGYDGVSLSQIEATAGISKPSLYSCFGNKEQLFREALDRYQRTSNALSLHHLDKTASLDEFIALHLGSAAHAYADAEIKSGCMILTGTIAGHPENAKLITELSSRRSIYQRGLVEKAPRRVPTETRLSLARCLIGVMQTLALQAHDGAEIEVLMSTALDMTEALKDRFAEKTRR